MGHALDAPDNKRQLHRAPTFLDGLLHISGRDAIACIVWDMSERGAKIGIGCDVPLPLYFEISLVDEDVRLPCEGRWRSGESVGVRFRLNRGP